MFEELLSNRYFTIALIIALALFVYMYSQKEPCEGMRNVDLTPLAQELTEKPWVNRMAGDYKNVGNSFDRFADKYVKLKLKKNGYDYTDFLARSDERFIEYENEGFDVESPEKKQMKKLSQKKQIKKTRTSIPMPLDINPELSQCQPCKCTTNNLMAVDDLLNSDS